MKKLTKTDIENEWNDLPKNWYAIYQWRRAKCEGYTEWIAELILKEISKILLVKDGLREKPFRVDGHKGQCTLSTGIEQCTEKRLVRAMFNSREPSLMGRVLDYEIPLKKNNQAKHGDIDLLCCLEKTVLCIEAKQPNASESVLKAILEAYVYTSLVSTAKVRFLNDFGLAPNLQLTPAVLTFAVSASGRQLREINRFPQLLSLVRTLNKRLVAQQIASLRFYIVNNPAEELRNCLTTTKLPNGDEKVVFVDGFSLSIAEQLLPD
jgi:hypothetical protein